MEQSILLCREILYNENVSQRELSEVLGYSLGKTNQIISRCMVLSYIERLEDGYRLTEKGQDFLNNFKVDNAVILAAGFGARFVPLTYEKPKGLIEVYGECMIERQIKQLQEKGIRDITIVVGYMKEKFDYLIDRYDVKLIFNEYYAKYNNLSSLYLARNLLGNTYILSADNWFSENIFNLYEPNSWYCGVFEEGDTSEWCMTIGSNNRLRKVVVGGSHSWVMYGPVYFDRVFSHKMINFLEMYYGKAGTENFMWEDILIRHLDDLPIYLNKQSKEVVHEFENIEELRAFDKSYEEESRNRLMKMIAEIFKIQEKQIFDIKPTKTGMTNNSFRFSVGNQQYIFRLPGEGSEELVNRKEEYAVYQAIKPLEISDNVYYFDEETGIKISVYRPGARNVDPEKFYEVSKCMEILRQLHQCGVQVDHRFDFRKKIHFYESLCAKNKAILYEDHDQTRENIGRLLETIQRFKGEEVLCHIDCVPDNFIILPDRSIELIDWEYSAMARPFIDLAMFSIYSYYEKNQIHELMYAYLEREATDIEIAEVYCYVALGGYLWSLWTQYKQSLGVEFGEYGMKMYRYAKDYYKHAVMILDTHMEVLYEE